ncbi:MAG: S41 family peptidase [Actinomycetota bacterium]
MLSVFRIRSSWCLLVAITLLSAGCSIGSETSGSTPPVVDSAPTTTRPVADPSEEPTPPTFAVQEIECEGRYGGLVCEAYSLITTNYVDPVSPAVLASAAADGVIELETVRPSGGATCAIPAREFLVVCQAMATEGARTEVAEEAALAAMVESLDPNSAYLNPEALRLLEEDQSGEVEGIGALVASEDLTAADPETTPCGVVSDTCRLVVVSTFADGPADRAGLEAGDVFRAVNGEDIDGRTIDEVTAAVRGPAGTNVELTVERFGELLTLSITRAALTIPVVETAVVDDTGYLRLNLFTETADLQVRQAISDMLSVGIDRLVLDLRDNPGGALDATVNIASEFLSDGVVVRTQSPDEETTYRVADGGLLTDAGVPLVVLVNRGSASASEVLSAALQERHRATIIGENTFGKNTVQQRYSLSNGGALKLTVARWVTALGVDFGESGVNPDVTAEFDPDLTIAEVVDRVASLARWEATT